MAGQIVGDAMPRRFGPGKNMHGGPDAGIIIKTAGGNRHALVSDRHGDH